MARKAGQVSPGQVSPRQVSYVAGKEMSRAAVVATFLHDFCQGSVG